MFPPVPDWDGLHPLMVHFPIALLLIAPLFLLVALFLPRFHRVFLVVALMVVAVGSGAAYLSVETGEAAAEFAIRTGGVDQVLERHEELAETTSMFFMILTVVLAIIVVVPPLLKKPLRGAVMVPVQIVFLAAYLVGTVVLANTAHQGGRLVHEFGVHSLVATSDQPLPSRSDQDD